MDTNSALSIKEIILKDDPDYISLLDNTKLSENDLIHFSNSKNMKCIDYIIDKGYTFADDCIEEFAYTNNLELIRYINERGAFALENKIFYCHYIENMDIVDYLIDVMGFKFCEEDGFLDDCLFEGNIQLIYHLMKKGYKVKHFDVNLAGIHDDNLIEALHKIGAECDDDYEIPDEYEICWKYYHNIIYNKSYCPNDCRYCAMMKIDTIKKARNEEQENLAQWLTEGIINELEGKIISSLDEEEDEE